MLYCTWRPSGQATGLRGQSGTSGQERENFVRAKFYCLRALADSIEHIQIREKMLEFSLVVLPMLSPYCFSVDGI